MAEGYLSTSGDYIEGDSLMGRLGLRREMADDHVDYAEVLSSGNHRVIWYGMTGSELARAAFGSFIEVSNWRSFLAGATSYPADIGWFGYGVAAVTGAVGPSANQRVLATGSKVWELVNEAAGITQAVSTVQGQSVENMAVNGVRDEIRGQIRDGIVDGLGDIAMDAAIGPQSLTKLAFMASVYYNYLATGGAYGFAGRMTGGFFTQQVVAFFLTRGAIPAQIAVTESRWFTLPMFGIVTVGSLVRLGEKNFDRFGNLDNLDFLSALVSATTGEDDPETISGITRNIYNGLRDQFRHLAWNYERDALERIGYSFGDEVPEYIRLRVRETVAELERLASIYSGNYGTPTEDTFYNFLIRAHNMCIRLQREGVDHPVVDKMVQLADPTVLHFARLLVFAVANVLKHINAASMATLQEYDFWSIMLAELEAGTMINNPNLTTGTE